jgi:hypothetical protein
VIDWSTGEPLEDKLETETYVNYATCDARNRPYLTTAADRSQIARSYNVSGWLESQQVAQKGTPDLWTKYIVSVTYTASGQKDTVAYGNGVTKSRSYDPLIFLELRCITWKQGRGAKVIFRDLYTTYDCLGKLVYREDQALQDIYFRNQGGQLTIATGREKIDAKTNTVQPYGPQYALQGDIPSDDQLRAYTNNITYDAVGNIARMQHVYIDQKVSGWTRNYEYEDENRLRSTKVGRLEDTYTYTSRGCMTSMLGAISMAWDYTDRLRYTTSQKVANVSKETRVLARPRLLDTFTTLPVLEYAR